MGFLSSFSSNLLQFCLLEFLQIYSAFSWGLEHILIFFLLLHQRLKSQFFNYIFILLASFSHNIMPHKFLLGNYSFSPINSSQMLPLPILIFDFLQSDVALCFLFNFPQLLKRPFFVQLIHWQQFCLFLLVILAHRILSLFLFLRQHFNSIAKDNNLLINIFEFPEGLIVGYRLMIFFLAALKLVDFL